MNGKMYSLFDIIMGSIVLIGIIAIGFALYLNETVTKPNHQIWLNKCIEKGGVPSKYEVIENKNTKREYLCIKPESIIQ